ncbi:MAG: NHL repeat-containing protein [Acidobacteriota bacterium]
MLIVADPISVAVLSVDLNAPSEPPMQRLWQGAPLEFPRSVVIDSGGDILIADEKASTVFRLDSKGGITDRYSSAILEEPYGLALDLRGLIYVSDTGTGQIVRIDPQTRRHEVVCDGQRFASPRGLAFTTDDKQLLVADYAPGPKSRTGEGKLVRLRLSDCKRTLEVTRGNPVGVVVDASGNVYVSDQVKTRIFRVDVRSRKATTIWETSEVWGLRGLALDAQGGILAAAYVAGKVIRIDPTTGEITRTLSGNMLDGPNGLALAAKSPPPPPPPPPTSTFAVEAGNYVWRITSADLRRDNKPLRLAGLMNRLVEEAGERQVRNLVLLLMDNNDYWWHRIQEFEGVGVRIKGKFVKPKRFEILSADGLDP